jgi:hypothetical protein
MRRSTGAVIFVIVAVLFTITYYKSPAFKDFIIEYAARIMKYYEKCCEDYEIGEDLLKNKGASVVS